MADHMETILAIAAATVVIGGALAALTKWVFVPGARLIRHTAEFLEDWRGSPARPGVAARPGVMERLTRVEYQTGRSEWHLGNGNATPAREIMENTEAEVKRLVVRVDEIETTVETHHPTAPTAHTPE